MTLRRKSVRRPAGAGVVKKLAAELKRLRTMLAEERAAREAEQESLLETQMELETAVARFSDLYDFAPVGYLTLSSAGIVRDINLCGARMLGTDRARLLGRPLRVLVRLPDRRKFQHYLLQLQKHPGELTVELKFLCGAGPRLLSLTSIVSTDRMLTEVHFRTIITDITDRKDAEHELTRLNETLRAILEAIPDIFMVFAPDGSMQFQNKAAEKFFRETGFERPPPEIHQELETTLKTGKHLLPTDLKQVHRFMIRHEERYFLSRIACLTGSESQTLGAVVMLQDVTELRLLDELKTGLISTVSHELKTPITSVRTALLVLLEQTFGPLNGKQTELLSLARDEGERLLHTLDTLLDLTRLESNAVEMRTENVTAKELVRMAIGTVWSAAINARMTVKTEVDAGLPTLAVDRERILHVLTNFLTNAIKYSPVASELVVRARRADRGVYFSVRDQGPGVPEQYRARVFEKFFRVPGIPAQGAGLGLSIAREFVRAHGGQIGLQSEPGKGSEFYFVLPVKDDAPAAA